MKVLYLNPTVAIGGAERSLLELVSGVDGDKVDRIAACVMEGPLAGALRDLGVAVTINPWPSFALKIGRGSWISKLALPLAALALVPHVVRMARLVRREGVAIIHTNGLKSQVIGWLVKRFTGCKLIWHVRDVLAPGLTRRFYAALARLGVDRVVANSKTVAATFPSLSPGRLRVVYNGLDLDRFAPGPAAPGVRESLGLGKDDFVVGALGALAPLKGHIHIIRAAPRILERCPRARFLIVGEEMYLTIGHQGHRAVLEDECRKLGVSSRVILAGYRADPIEVMRSLDLLVHASVRPESFGRVLVEAMACGVPVIATALGGPTEIIAGEEQGILIPPGSPEAIAEAVLELHADPDRRSLLGLRGRDRVVQAFEVSRYVREIESIYDELAA